MTDWKIEAAFLLTSIGAPVVAYLARPRPKPSEFEHREARNRTARLRSIWIARKTAHQESRSAYEAFRQAKADQLRLETQPMRNRAVGWRGK